MNHSRLIHPHIVRFHECFLTDKHLAIVMEYAAGGSLYSHVTAKYVRVNTAFAAAILPEGLGQYSSVDIADHSFMRSDWLPSSCVMSGLPWS